MGNYNCRASPASSLALGGHFLPAKHESRYPFDKSGIPRTAKAGPTPPWPATEEKPGGHGSLSMLRRPPPTPGLSCMEAGIRFTVAEGQHLTQAKAKVITPTHNERLENPGLSASRKPKAAPPPLRLRLPRQYPC